MNIDLKNEVETIIANNKRTDLLDLAIKTKSRIDYVNNSVVRLEEIKDANRLWYQLDKERTNERTLAIAGLTDALVINRKPNIERAVKKFDEFNKKYAGTYPKDLITLDSLDAAYQNRLKQLGLNWRGAQLTEKNADVANQVLGPSHVVKPIAP